MRGCSDKTLNINQNPLGFDPRPHPSHGYLLLYINFSVVQTRGITMVGAAKVSTKGCTVVHVVPLWDLDPWPLSEEEKTLPVEVG